METLNPEKMDTKNMEYEEIKLLKQSDKNTVQIVRKKGEKQLYIRKVLKGQYPVYLTLKNCHHPFLPRLYEVTLSDSSTTVIEEYIEGESPGNIELSKRQFRNIVRELCSVLDYLHGKGIIHRDIKPSNLILAKDGHIRLLDFDAARIPKDDLEQDTRLLGTRGYAPPEQYGFSQTDERTDIYALGITLKQLLGNNIRNSRCRKILRKCTDLNPDKRYQSAREVEQAFFHKKRNVVFASIILLLFLMSALIWANIQGRPVQSDNNTEGLTVLSAPANPRWYGDTGIALWGIVLESGHGDQQRYYWKLYRRDTAVAPAPDDTDYVYEGSIGGNVYVVDDYQHNLSYRFDKNGFYYFAVSAVGDGVNYSDSPFVISDAFEFTGENAPSLPAPAGLAWNTDDVKLGTVYAVWSNLDDYNDLDNFDAIIYDQNGNFVINNRFSKEQILQYGHPGVPFYLDKWYDANTSYRFAVQVYSSRPNEYAPFMLPDPVPEESLSDWYSP